MMYRGSSRYDRGVGGAASVDDPTRAHRRRLARVNPRWRRITVTAQKRSENAQRAPLVVQSLSGRTLETAHVTSALDLTRVVPRCGG